MNALQSGSGVHIKPTKTQSGGFLGTLLASIGIPLALEAVKKLTGRGAPRMGKSRPPRSTESKGGKGAPRLGLHRSPPIIGNWGDQYGMGRKKKKVLKKGKKGKREKGYCSEKTVRSKEYQ